jgi:ParB family chromosome partitioning protein
MSKKPALGKGLSALLSNNDTDVLAETKEGREALVGSVAELDIDSIEANPFQPRNEFEKEALEELSESIKELGIIQPVTVRKMGKGKFQLISGERRFRASKLAGLTKIPAFIRIANDQAMLEMALVENIQRENLNAIDISLSYNRLIEECNLTQEELSTRVGKKRSTITNYLRLLNLPAEIQHALRDSKISMGHARALVSIEDEEIQLAIFREIEENELSVRQVEEMARGYTIQTKEDKKAKRESKKEKGNLSFSELKLKSELHDLFKTKVEIVKNNKGKGKIVIAFNSKDDFERITSVFEN